jgi:hypothetical protein
MVQAAENAKSVFGDQPGYSYCEIPWQIAMVAKLLRMLLSTAS